MNPQTGEIWQHYKTKGDYKIINIAKLQVKDKSLDMCDCVIYKSLKDNNVWVRPLNDFIEKLDINGITLTRFKKIS